MDITIPPVPEHVGKLGPFPAWVDGYIAGQAVARPLERICLWSSAVTPHWYFLAELTPRTLPGGTPIYETADPVVPLGSPEAAPAPSTKALALAALESVLESHDAEIACNGQVYTSRDEIVAAIAALKL